MRSQGAWQGTIDGEAVIASGKARVIEATDDRLEYEAPTKRGPLRVAYELGHLDSPHIVRVEAGLFLEKPTTGGSADHWEVDSLRLDLANRVAQHPYVLNLTRSLRRLKTPNSSQPGKGHIGQVGTPQSPGEAAERIRWSVEKPVVEVDAESVFAGWSSGNGQEAVGLYRTRLEPPLWNIARHEVVWSANTLAVRETAREEVGMHPGRRVRELFLIVGNVREMQESMVELHNTVYLDPPPPVRLEGESRLPSYLSA